MRAAELDRRRPREPHRHDSAHDRPAPGRRRGAPLGHLQRPRAVHRPHPLRHAALRARAPRHRHPPLHDPAHPGQAVRRAPRPRKAHGGVRRHGGGERCSKAAFHVLFSPSESDRPPSAAHSAPGGRGPTVSPRFRSLSRAPRFPPAIPDRRGRPPLSAASAAGPASRRVTPLPLRCAPFYVCW
ncbi:hypothetical protein EMIHUDRAFT_456571, partial [Emiliania huxleyi CCMP1516]|uniref:Uncharacterized protein n=2 Tax=Emiliania huxleyi TaxID=2903 RepID=A0A0D3K421_EMIH1